MKRLLLLVADLAVIVSCFVAAMALRLESLAFLADARVWLAFAPVLALTVAGYVAFGLYRAVLRYISGQVLVVILLNVALSSVALAVSAVLTGAPVPRSVPVIYAVLLLTGAAGLRYVFVLLFRRIDTRLRRPVIIYGAGEAGRQLAQALLAGPDYLPVAFVDDEASLHGVTVAGRRVAPPASLPRLIARHGARTILLAMPSIGRARRRQIVAELEPLGVEVKMLPGMADIVSGRATFSELRRVSPEDLLGRDPVPPRPELMCRNIRGKVVLVTGAGGSIGSELCRQILPLQPAALILLDVSEYALFTIHNDLRQALARSGQALRIEAVLGSVQNLNRMRALLRDHGVQTVYHAAAYKHVALVEDNVVEGVRNNVFGTQVVAQAAREQGVESVILVSTDKAVRPTNVMGASKRLAELVCQAAAQGPGRTVFSIVRFGNVLGSSGSVIPLFRDQIERGGPVTVTHPEVTRFFMTIPEAAQLVIQAGAMARGGDVFVLDMGEPVRILDLAFSMVRLHGLQAYVADPATPGAAPQGDIAIEFTGLKKGEKLYEELLIGNNPSGTEHPRILTAQERALAPEALDALLDRLMTACLAFDLDAIRALLAEAPLDYRPQDLSAAPRPRPQPAPAVGAPVPVPALGVAALRPAGRPEGDRLH